MGHYDEQHTRRRAHHVMHIGDGATREAIVRVVCQLPGDALDLAVDKCFFVSVGGAVEGQARPMGDIAHCDWVIVIDDQPRHLTLELGIAHEIAHAYLGHGVKQPVPPEAERERQVQEQLRKWGFTEESAS